ncbi:MAG: TonB-dependent receptor [Steroidobacteraceae bacterium]
MLSFVPLLASTLPVSAMAEEIGEVIVLGEGIGSMRLDATNEAGSRLGLTPLQTPASVDMVTSEEIATKGDYDALLAVTRTTGLSISANPGNGGTSISARGFDGHGSITETYDGTRLYIAAGTVTFPADTWTLDRVEVLRGAGSVINGLGAIGATVNYVPKTPKPGTSSAEALVALGSFNLQRIALGGGTDLGSSLSFRLDGAHQSSDGQVMRNEKERNVFAGSLLFKPSETFSTRLSVDYADVHEDSPYFGTPTINGQASDALRKQNYNFADGFFDYKDMWARVHTEWKFASNATLRNDTYLLTAKRQWQNMESYIYSSATGLIDRDGYSYYGIKHDQQQIGTRSDVLLDLQLGGLDNKLTVGFDANGIDLDYSNNWSDGLAYSGNSVPVYGWTPDTRADANIPTVLAFTTDTTQYGLFFDDVLKLNPQWSVVLGARYDSINFSRTNLALADQDYLAFDSKYSEWSWRGGVVFEPAEGLSLYAQYSRANDPITSPVTMGSGSKNYDPTRGRQYEVGLKQQLMGGKAEYTLAWFDIVKTGLVTRRSGALLRDPSDQIGQQSSSGIEATLRLNPANSVSMDFNAAWVDARYDEYYSGDKSFADNKPSNVPEVTANAWVNWTPLQALSLGAGARYVGSRFADDANTYELPAYTVLDARAGWNFSERLQLNVRARNLTDEKNYVLSAYDGADQWVFGEPRTYEVSLKYSL